jgi:4-aminobutyrate aminotransferase
MDHYGVSPDVLVFAKGIASGFPLSGIAAPGSLMNTQPPGSMGGTYAGNAVSCAAAVATIAAMQDEGMLANAVARGEQLRGGLAELQKRLPIADVRGLGLMVGVEFEPAAGGVAGAVTQECLARGMLLLQTSVYDTVRFIPPLNVSEDEVKMGLEIFASSVDAVLAKQK